jgi:hypothetical protein
VKDSRQASAQRVSRKARSLREITAERKKRAAPGIIKRLLLREQYGLFRIRSLSDAGCGCSVF